MTEKETSNPLDIYSARVRNLLIELNEYTYFHSPSEIDKIDKRFTGRDQVLDRLKSLLTDSEVPSGAYLVTGYRGAGKSSLVAKAIADVTFRFFHSKKSSRYLRLAVALLPISVLGGMVDSLVFVLMTVLVWFLLLVYVCWTDPQYPDLLEGSAGPEQGPYDQADFPRRVPEVIRRILWRQAKKWPDIKRSAWDEILEKALRQNFRRAFRLVEEAAPRQRFRVFAQDLLVLLTLLLSAQVIFIPLSVDSFVLRLTILTVMLVTYITVNGTVDAIDEAKTSKQTASRMRDEPDRSPRHRIAIDVVHGAWKRIKDYFRYSNRVHIKINLSQDDIQELDILRSIARNLHLTYRSYVESWRYDLHWRAIRALFLVTTVVLIYGAEPAYRLNSGIKRSLHISCYFPSQGVSLLEGGATRYFDLLEQQNPLDAREFRKQLRKSPSSSQLNRTPHEIHGKPADSLGKLRLLGMDLTTYFDMFVQLNYRRLLDVIPDQIEGFDVTSMLSVRGLHEPLVLFPERVDYLFFVYLFLTWWGSTLLLRSSVLGLVSHRRVLRRLKELNELIETQVTNEKGLAPIPANTFLSISFGKRQRLTSLTLNERDIEKHLFEILDLIARLPRLTARPEFIIVFDELDKIQHLGNYSVRSKEWESSTYQGREFSSLEAERERQHKILALVSNLKHFLTTAPVKFIFIAGREMFDAALADVSDRHYFMGSVFNEVLHVPSFHTDGSDNRQPDITSLTEMYLCRFLLPRSYWRQDFTLNCYRTYLEEELLPDTDSEDPWRNRMIRQRREKILYELQHFVTYLTYRSNGAPKKITEFVERYLIRPGHDLLTDDDSFVVGKSSRSFYLHLKYEDQYTFGLITYLASPLILSLNRSIKDYGDKILVSSSFLLDHIYKFHGYGFSWRNLELLPEIVDINRAPQLRELIRKIMAFLAKSDVAEITSGLYDFKFTRRITEEIAFLSKISEFESAAFNFTLDESLAIKRHFDRKLQKLLAIYDNYPNSGTEKFINSVAFLRMILGDLHFYDGELDSAIVEYMEAVQSLRDIEISTIRIDTLVLMVRNFLKLGLAYERKRSYESALVTYGRISAIVTRVGERSIQTGGKSLHPSDRLFGQTAFEGIRLIYQPMFARLQLMEKSALGGVTNLDIDRLLKEFDRMTARQQVKDRFLIEIEFKNKLADVLFFKNGPAPRKAAYCWPRKSLCLKNPDRPKLLEQGRRLPCTSCSFYHEALGLLASRYLGIGKLPKGPDLLVHLLKRFETGKAEPDRSSTVRELGTTISSIGNTFLSCSGRCELDTGFLRSVLALADVDENETASGSTSERLERALKGHKPNKTEQALVYFLTSALLFRRVPDSRSCSRELSKILWVIREVLSLEPPEVKAARTESQSAAMLEAAAMLTKAAIRECYRSHEGTHRIEIEKIKEMLEDENRPGAFVDKVNLGRLSINAALTEIVVLFDEISLALAGPELITVDHRTSPFSMVHSVFSRIHTLRCRSGINFHNFRRIALKGAKGGDERLEVFLDRRLSDKELEVSARELRKSFRGIELGKVFPAIDDIEVDDALEFLITDSIYCHYEIIRSLEIYSISYMASHSMRASAHRNLAKWCDYYYSYLRYRKGVDLKSGGTHPGVTTILRLKEKLKHLVGPAELVSLGPNYHREKALFHYNSAREAHSEGKAYSSLISNMYYLNDDYADQLEQFCAGLERLRLNSGDIDKAIDGLHRNLATTVIHDPDEYMHGGWAHDED